MGESLFPIATPHPTLVQQASRRKYELLTALARSRGISPPEPTVEEDKELKIVDFCRELQGKGFTLDWGIVEWGEKTEPCVGIALRFSEEEAIHLMWGPEYGWIAEINLPKGDSPHTQDIFKLARRFRIEAAPNESWPRTEQEALLIAERILDYYQQNH
jgi:hypothetical protein